jgi:hypothetical protein
MRLDDASPDGDIRSFSLVLGGPLYQLYLRSRLARPPLELLHRRIIALVLLTWVPPAVLSLLEGHAVGGVAVPFFKHLAVHVRFLISLPLLIMAETIVHQRVMEAVAQFSSRRVVAPEARDRFDAAIASAERLRNSVGAELVLLILAWTIGYSIWKQNSLGAGTWYSNGAGSYTIAGYWYVFVSLPLFRFILIRWGFRLLIWFRFLWSVSRLPLRLDALHPDHAGGLGFLGETPFTLLAVFLAQTFLLSGKIADHIWHDGATLPHFKLEIVAILLIQVLLGYFPLIFFVPQLARARREGLRDYGIVATNYVSAFREKWITRATSEKEPLLGTADIQSLADLSNSFNVAGEMNLLPFTNKSILRMAIILALPILPLLLTMIPLSEIIDRLLKMVL